MMRTGSFDTEDGKTITFFENGKQMVFIEAPTDQNVFDHEAYQEKLKNNKLVIVNASMKYTIVMNSGLCISI